MSGRMLRWLWSLTYRAPRAAGPRLTIIRHHRVFVDGDRPLYRLGVSASVLDQQLAFLARLGLGPVGVGEALARLENGGSRRVVAMTFDDGYRDNVTGALPLLLRHGARATFYLTAGLMEERRAPWWDVLASVLERTDAPRLDWSVAGRPVRLGRAGSADRGRALAALVPRLRVPPAEQRGRLEQLAARLGVRDPVPCALATWDEARALPEAGMEVGAHTLSHPLLDLLPPGEQEREIAGSVELIEHRLGRRPTGFAYPGGRYDRTSVAIVERLGLGHAVTNRRGDNPWPPARYELRRRGLSEGACLAPGGQFSRRLALAELEGAFDCLRGVEAPS